MSKLILARHGESEWNKLGKWAGMTDVGLTEQGRMEARQAGMQLSGLAIHIAYTSELIRARDTLDSILLAQDRSAKTEVNIRSALNEKDYGVFTGKNKQQIRTEVGNEEFLRIRRSWDYRPEGGESLEDVHARVMPLHYKKILPLLLAFHKDEVTILAVSHNNTLRAYIKELEDIPEDKVSDIELGTAEIRIYDFDAEGRIYDKTVHAIGEVH